MSEWENKLDDYIDEEEGYEYFAHGTYDDDEEDLRVYFFGSIENSERFFRHLRKKAEGTHVLNPQKVRELNTLISVIKIAFGKSVQIKVGSPNVMYNTITVSVESENLTIENPGLLWAALSRHDFLCDFTPKTTGTVEFSAVIPSVFIKLDEKEEG